MTNKAKGGNTPAKNAPTPKTKISKTVVKRASATKAKSNKSLSMRDLATAYADAVASVKKNPTTLAKAHVAAFSDMFGMMTARANGCNKPPTKLEKVGDAWMICYLQDDCSYGNCQPYVGDTE